MDGEARLWSEMRAAEIGAAAARGDVALLPIGAVEQHGPHLPVDTDIAGAHAAAIGVARRLPYTLVAPPVWWGLSAAHAGFPGLLSLSPATFMTLLGELSDCIVGQGFERLVFVVGHASNKPVVGLIVDQVMRRYNVAAMQVNYLELGRDTFLSQRVSTTGDAHAGELETAVQLHLRPQLVDMPSAPAAPIDPSAHYGHSAAARDMYDRGRITIGFDLQRAFPDGVMGDASVATAELGSQIWEEVVQRACELVREYWEAGPSTQYARKVAGDKSAAQMRAP